VRAAFLQTQRWAPAEAGHIQRKAKYRLPLDAAIVPEVSHQRGALATFATALGPTKKTLGHLPAGCIGVARGPMGGTWSFDQALQN